MARVTSNLKTSDMMRKGVNPETVSALATLWRARFEELTARAQEEAAEGEDTRCVAHVFRYLQQSSQGLFQVFKTPKVTSLCLLLPLSTTQSLGEAQQQRPPTHLPLNGSMPTVLIRRMASETSAVIWHATFVQKLIPVRILNVFFARARCPSCARHVVLILGLLSDLGGGAAAVPVRDGDFTKQLLLEMEQQEQ